MSCMNQALVKQLAAETEVKILETLTDRKDKLRSKLYMKKLEIFFESNYLHRCTNCSALFTKAQRKWQECPGAREYIDAHGNAKHLHTLDAKWDLNKFVLYLRNTKKIEWPAIYWKLVAAATTYDCLRCEKPFAANTMNQCDYHLSVPFEGIEPS